MIATSHTEKMFGLFWDSSVSEKIANGDRKYAMAQDVPITSSCPRPPTTLLKRKRNSDLLLGIKCEESPLDVKRRKEDRQEIHVAPSLPKVPKEKIVPPVVSQLPPETTPETTSKIDALRGVLESQLSLEILFKHGELRLINQELAKCQTAYEQLRRCHLIPYPTSKASPFDPLDVSTGTGPAIEPGPGMPTPELAAPYGVTDGPYTRHYAKWLIPDPRFDGIQPETTVNFRSAGEPFAEGRTTRYSIADGSIPSLRGSSSRSQRGSTTLQALSSGYPQQKNRDGPCIVKRKDGQSVKLVCLDCNRWDFHSTQGFINHCRIEHKRSYKSHAEAAISCGQPIELDEDGGIVGEESSPVDPGLVHPLIKSTPTDRQTYVNILAHINASLQKFQHGELPGVTAIPTGSDQATHPNVKVENPNFVSSPETPFLSNKLKKAGFNGNLDEIVTEAKTKVNLEELDGNEEEEEDSENEKKFITAGSKDWAPRIPARSPAHFSRPISGKGLDRTAGRNG